MNFPKILVAHHKHSDDYFIVNSEEDIRKAKFKLIQDWNAYGMFYAPSEVRVSPKDQELLDMENAAVVALPDTLRTEVIYIRNKIKKAQRRYNQEIAEYKMITEVLNMDSDEAINKTVKLSGNQTAYVVSYIVDAYGHQEYTEWELVYPSSID